MGFLLLQEGDEEAAKTHFQKALESDPQSFPAALGMGQCHMIRQEYAEAETYLSRAISLEPGYGFAYLDRATVRQARGNYSGAIEDLSTAIGLEPDYAWSYLDRGKLYLRVGRKEEAEEDFEKTLALEADNFLAHVYLAGLYYEDNRWEEALVHYRFVVRLKKDYRFAYAPLGILHYCFTNWQEAERALKQAYRYEPGKPTYALMAALALKRDGRDAEAAAYLQEIERKLPRESWHYAVARFYQRPNYDLAVLERWRKEKSEVEKKRMSFYIASQYLISGTEGVARQLFIDLIESKELNVTEVKLAQWELKNSNMGS
jgi:tetratricopeptide (TPR) repeat protein